MKDFRLQDHSPRTPYRVPDGYFDTLASRVMSNLPDTSASADMPAAETPRIVIPQPRRRRWIGWSVAAAACVGAVLMLTSLPRQEQDTPNTQTAKVSATTSSAATASSSSSSSYDENYEQEVLEYAMVDGSDIYAYMSGGL